jgi:histone H3/H4
MAKGARSAKPQVAAVPAAESESKVVKRRTGQRTLAVRRIKTEQSKNALQKPAVPRAVMGRFIRAIAREVDPVNAVHWAKEGMRAVHTATEHCFVDLFKSMAVVSGSNKRVTTMERDWEVAMRLRSANDLCLINNPDVTSSRIF